MTGLTDAAARVLRPLLRLALHRGAGFPDLSALLRRLYVAEGAALLRRRGEKVTDSRLSLLTGLQRREVKALRAEAEAEAQAEREAGMPGDGPPPWTAGPLARLAALWRADPAWSDSGGRPLALPRTAAPDAPDAPSFEALARAATRDMHPRSLLDEALRRGMAEERDGRLVLSAEAFLPDAQEEAALGHFGAALGDHAAAAVANLIAAEGPPFFERAAHANRLTPEALAALDRFARAEQQAALERIMAEALRLQRESRGAAGATGRFRCGGYIFHIHPGDAPEETRE